MPRTVIATEAPAGPYPTLPLAADAADLTFVPADVSNLNAADFGTKPRMLVLVQNSDAVNPETVTFTSRADTLNRTGDIAEYSIGAGEIAAFLFERNGWRQDDGNLYFEASSADVRFAVLTF